MIQEFGRFIGVGFASVNYIYKGGDEFPITSDQALAFIETHKPYLIQAGGNMPNTFTALLRTSLRHGRLFYCLGNDSRGDFFQQQTDPRIGPAQISSSESTGVWVASLDEDGRLRYGISSYGASLKVHVPKEELEKERNGVFITDLSACKDDEIHSQADRVLKQLEFDAGVFVLSLAGARPSSEDAGKSTSAIAALRYHPHIVFSNAKEFRDTAGSDDIEKSIFTHFPNSRLLVVTIGSEGSIIRFEDSFIKVPTFPIEIKNDIGAGDAYMGVMLGRLFNYPYKIWTERMIRQAAQLATFAASLIVSSSGVRLDIEQAKTILSVKYPFH